MVRIQSARAGKHPDRGPFEQLRLRADGRFRPVEGMTVSPQSEKRDHRGTIAAHLGCQPPSSGTQFRRRELGGACGRASDQIRQPVAGAKKQAFLRGMEEPRRDPGAGECRPEPVSGTCKVVPRRCRVQPGVDAAEKYLQAGPDHVLQRAACRRRELRLTGPRGRCSRPTFRRARA